MDEIKTLKSKSKQQPHHYTNNGVKIHLASYNNHCIYYKDFK